jgi:hypothetical protein
LKSPEVESHGLELTEKVFSEEAVHWSAAGRAALNPENSGV